MAKDRPPAPHVYLSCAPEDQEHRVALERHLAPLVARRGLRLWHRGFIAPGQDESTRARETLDAATLILLLVSSDYLAAEPGRAEMERAIQRSREEGVTVVPILLRPCYAAGEPFAHLASVPPSGRAVTLWPERDEAWALVAEGIEQAIGQSASIDRQPLAARPNEDRSATKDAPDSAAIQMLEKLESARTRRCRLAKAGASTAALDEEIRASKRQLREGGQVKQGDLLGSRYTLLRCLGRGGFATVWEAEDREKHGRVAVKVLHANLAGDSLRRARFFRGARVMSELEHPTIVRILEAEAADGGFFYFVMEHIDGEDLRHAVNGGRVLKERALPIALAVGEALAFAHEKGFVHRDVKPANVLLNGSGEPKLTDFDLVGGGDTTGGTRTGALGSFLYAAPETMSCPQEADARADVFGLAMTAVFVIHGGNLPMRAFQHPSLFVDGLACDARTKEVLKRALDWEPNKRFRDAGELCAALGGAVVVKSSPPVSVLSWTEGEDDVGRFAAFTVGNVEQRMRWIPPGTFLMGSPPDEASRNDDEEQREVTLTRGYWLAETPCTQALWQAVMGENPSRFKGPNRPVESVSWDDCQGFLTKLDHLVPALGARLPTEAEWEYACRAGTTGAHWAADLDAIAWYGDTNGGGTHPVGHKDTNRHGLRDMLGNVWEWCEDWYDAYDAARAIDPRGPRVGGRRVIRGGSWRSLAEYCRAACRDVYDPRDANGGIGFRLARGQDREGGAEPLRVPRRGA